MNDNERKFSNTPYKATGNLNTVIGNPDINMNSAVTSNIMEGQFANASLNNNSINNLSVAASQENGGNLNFGSDPNVVSGFVSNPNKNSNEASVDYNSVSSDPVRDFVNKTVPNTATDISGVNSEVSNSVVYNSVDSSVNNYSSNSVSGVNNSNVQYENVYETDKKKKPKKTVKIPSEFKTAVFVVLILLIILSCFDTVYDFFKDFWINR